jgi:hypothetical protein
LKLCLIYFLPYLRFSALVISLAVAVIAFAPLPLVVLSYMDALSTRAFAAAFTVYWVALLVVAATRLVRGKGSLA